jgi:hypothetical protein
MDAEARAKAPTECGRSLELAKCQHQIERKSFEKKHSAHVEEAIRN